jgi:hypothetical protein
METSMPPPWRVSRAEDNSIFANEGSDFVSVRQIVQPRIKVRDGSRTARKHGEVLGMDQNATVLNTDFTV